MPVWVFIPQINKYLNFRSTGVSQAAKKLPVGNPRALCSMGAACAAGRWAALRLSAPWQSPHSGSGGTTWSQPPQRVSSRWVRAWSSLPPAERKGEGDDCLGFLPTGFLTLNKSLKLWKNRHLHGRGSAEHNLAGAAMARGIFGTALPAATGPVGAWCTAVLQPCICRALLTCC